MHRSTVLSIAIIVIGGLMVAGNVPYLCKNIYEFVDARKRHADLGPSNVIVSLVKVVTGLLLMGAQRQIVNGVEKNRS